MESNKLKFLIQLLDDQNKEVYTIVRNELLRMGEQSLPKLKEEWLKLPKNNLLSDRLYDIIININVNTYKYKFREWVEQEEPDLFLGLFYLNKIYHSEINFDTLKQQLNQILDNIALTSRNNYTILEKINIINHFLFKEMDYKVQTEITEHNHFFDTAFLGKLLNPITSLLLYYQICNYFGISIKPIIAGKAFLLATIKPSAKTKEIIEKKDLSFFILPPGKGTIINKDFRIKNKDLNNNIYDIIKHWISQTILLLKEREEDIYYKTYQSLLKNLINEKA